MRVLDAVMKAGVGRWIRRPGDEHPRVVNTETLRRLSDEDARADDWEEVPIFERYGRTTLDETGLKACTVRGWRRDMKIDGDELVMAPLYICPDCKERLNLGPDLVWRKETP